MRKRSKYRPKAVLVNPVAYVVEGMTPVAQHDNFLVDLKIRNHMAMSNLTRGQATRDDMEELVMLGNVVEALLRMGFGKEYSEISGEGIKAILDVARRGLANDNKFILNAKEMNALNNLMELHDAQMDVVAVRHIEQAMELIDKEKRNGKTQSIVEKTS
jgi:hypothetical protein